MQPDSFTEEPEANPSPDEQDKSAIGPEQPDPSARQRIGWWTACDVWNRAAPGEKIDDTHLKTHDCQNDRGGDYLEADGKIRQRRPVEGELATAQRKDREAGRHPEHERNLEAARAQHIRKPRAALARCRHRLINHHVLRSGE